MKSWKCQKQPAPGGTGCFWHVGCLPLKYLTLPESGDFRPRPAAYFRASYARVTCTTVFPL
ncbi:hypothetical protein GXU17_003910 [Escherichia coli]|nr:hypothetical protein [Escherichia coli]EFI4247502.1 hypothetical protein [Escherichia coli]EFI5849991.1 hypothetical protein [Escherichia coli]EFI8299801.1 hypothetical protein [Escherichia coli]EFI9519385.1 hypothetical protein [Escherichia coli]